MVDLDPHITKNINDNIPYGTKGSYEVGNNSKENSMINNDNVFNNNLEHPTMLPYSKENDKSSLVLENNFKEKEGRNLGRRLILMLMFFLKNRRSINIIIFVEWNKGNS